MEQSGDRQRDLWQKCDRVDFQIQMDYWITAGDTPAEIEEAYANATGKVPMMPEYGLGFWQCKLRYQTQEELLEVAREYHRRGLKVDVIVADFFHWPAEGDWKFDKDSWPGTQGNGYGADGIHLADRRCRKREL